MTIISIRKLSVPLIFAVASLSAGILGGTTTVHGLSANGYGSAQASKLETDATDSGRVPQEGQPAAYEDCQGCSERDRGYHWAALQKLASIADCPMDSWDFRRGCVAYMRDAGGV